jgi:hypothetical protein
VIERLAADLVLTLHFAFVAFVMAGGVLVRRWRRFLVPHLLAVAWGTYVEAVPGVLCPLTTWENELARRAGEAGYQGSFIEHYLVPILYPDALSPAMQRILAVLVVLVNVVVYAWPHRHAAGAPGGTTRA